MPSRDVSIVEFVRACMYIYVSLTIIVVSMLDIREFYTEATVIYM